jgi:hypothetical protein
LKKARERRPQASDTNALLGGEVLCARFMKASVVSVPFENCVLQFREMPTKLAKTIDLSCFSFYAEFCNLSMREFFIVVESKLNGTVADRVSGKDSKAKVVRPPVFGSFRAELR